MLADSMYLLDSLPLDNLRLTRLFCSMKHFRQQYLAYIYKPN